MSQFIEIQIVVKRFGANTVLRNISLGVNKGEMVTLLGPSGCGKSTLLRAISGVIDTLEGGAFTGDFRLTGADPLEIAKRVAVVPQGSRLPPGFTVEEIVMMGRAPYLDWAGRAHDEDVAAAQSALQQAGALEFARRMANHLSAGEQQRVILARALAQNTSILLLDEPTTHLDLYYQLETLQTVRRLASERGLAVLMALHDLNLAARFSDDVLLLKDGQCAASGTANDVFTERMIAEVFNVEVEFFHPLTEKLPIIQPLQKTKV